MGKGVVVGTVVGVCAGLGAVAVVTAFRSTHPVEASSQRVSAEPPSRTEDASADDPEGIDAIEANAGAIAGDGAVSPSAPTVAVDEGILAAICTDTPERDAKGTWTCTVADACEGFDTTKATVDGAYSGRFSAADSEEMVLDLGFECASHAENWGGAAFLRREAGAWRKIALGAGERPGACKPWAPGESERTTLVCETGYTNNGYTSTFLFHRTYDASGASTSEAVVEALDDEGNSDCHASADTLEWKVDGAALQVTYRESRSAVEPPEPRECATPLPRVDTVRSFFFTRQGVALVVSPEGREAYAALKKVQAGN